MRPLLRINVRNSWPILVVVLVGSLLSNAAQGSPATRKRSKADRNIDSIGHRKIGHSYGLGNWYSLDKEKEIGAQASAFFEKSRPLLHDSTTEAYLDQLAQAIARNSDSQFPITIRVIDSEDSYALTFAGGYQYITRGLLLKLQSEGELSAALARGIAHTALRSATGEATLAELMGLATIPPSLWARVDFLINSTDPGFAVPLTPLKSRRDDELDADYFGVQYLYKSGYDPQCFIGFIQKAWPTSGKNTPTVVSPFSPLPERLRLLEKEISQILPKRSWTIASRQEFTDFQKHLLSLSPPNPLPKSVPTLLRGDPQTH